MNIIETNKTINATAAASTIKSSDLYMTIVATLFTSPSANLNGVRCTEQFIDDIVANQDDFVGLPLYADVKNLEKGKFDHLGHMYNSETDEFGSTMIGSFYKYEKTVAENGEVALVGYARVMKRNKDIRDAIMNLFADNKLKFSFEISVGSYIENDDDTITIDKADKNFLEGMAIVSNPACPEAVALDLVAEVKEEEVSEMQTEETIVSTETTEVIEKAEETVVVAEEQATSAQEPVLAEEEVAETPKPLEEKDEEPEEEKKEECCSEVEEASCKEKCSEEEEACKKCSEEETSCEKKCSEEEEAEEENAACKKKTAEELIAELTESLNKVLKEIAETRTMVEEQKTEIAELKTKKEVVVDTPNPFLAEMDIDTRSLLNSETKSFTSYSLLD